MTRRGAKGFTLIEMLVVIGIIAVLAAIIIPVYSRAQERGRQASCISNLKAIAIAMRMYHQELKAYPPPYDPSMPEYTGLGALYTAGYLDNVRALRCPDDPNRNTMGQYESSYNEYYNYWGYKTTDASDPAQIGIPCEADGDNPATPAVEGPSYSSWDAAQVYRNATNQRQQALWATWDDSDTGEWSVTARGRSAAFPGLVNNVAGDGVVITRCRHHRQYFGTNAEQDIVAFLGGNVEAVQLRTYDWTTQPMVE